MGVKPGQSVVAITAAGGRIFTYARYKPAVIHAVDQNPCQQHVFLAQLEGIRRLEYEDFLAFVGVYPNNGAMGVTRKNRCWEVYLRVRPHLRPATREFFDRQPNIIKKGLLFSGSLEFGMREHAWSSGVVVPRKRQTLFEFTDLEAQKRWVDRHWPGWRWRLYCRMLVYNPLVVRLFTRDEAFSKYKTYREPLWKLMEERADRMLHRALARDNYLLGFRYWFNYKNGHARPVYLDPQGFVEIKAALPTIEIRVETKDIGELCRELEPGSIDHVSLSDICDYMPGYVHDEYLRAVARVLKPGGRVCWKYFMADYPLPADLTDVLQPNGEAEQLIRTTALDDYDAHILERLT